MGFSVKSLKDLILLLIGEKFFGTTRLMRAVAMALEMPCVDLAVAVEPAHGQYGKYYPEVYGALEALENYGMIEWHRGEYSTFRITELGLTFVREKLHPPLSISRKFIEVRENA